MTEPTDISIRDRAVFVPPAQTLVIADLHLGRAADSRLEAPIDDGGAIREQLEGALTATDPETVVIAGDLLHAFGHVPRGVERDLAALEAVITDSGASLVVTPGNHDTMLESVFDGEMTAEYRLADGETVVCHGHEAPTTDASRYVIGHDHPALSVDGRKLPCFLFGPDAYAGGDVLMCPAFTPLAAGATVNGMTTRDAQSPLVTDADLFQPVVWDDSSEEPLWFPPLGDCRTRL